MDSILLLGNDSFTSGLRSQVRGLASLSVVATDAANEAVLLVEKLSPGIVIVNAHALEDASISKTLEQSQSAYIIVINVEQPPALSERALAALRIDKTAFALESGADAYLWLPLQEQFEEETQLPLGRSPIASNHAAKPHTADSIDRAIFASRPAAPGTKENVKESRAQPPQHLPTLALQPNQCRLIQAHIQIGLNRVQQYRNLSRINDWLSAVALVDALTQLNNRRAFDLELPSQIRMAQQKQTPMSIMVLDIDAFKSVNDRFGHLVGDDMLKQLARRLLANMRFYDTPFRYGGEEFVITLNNTDAVEGAAIANRLRRLIAKEPFRLTHPHANISSLKITVSIGLTQLQPADDQQGRSFLERADKNLLQAKAAGRNRVVSA